MSNSLVSFHFNPFKLGQICKQYAKDRGFSQAVMAARTGLSYDTVGNIYAGKVQKIPFEYVFKFCVVLAIPIEVVMMLMLKDEDIDFAEQVLLYNTVEDKPVPVEDAVPDLVPGDVPAAVVDTAVNVAAADPVIEAAIAPAENLHNGYTVDELRTIINKITVMHDAHIQDLKDVHVREQETSAKHCEQLYNLAMSLANSGLA